MRHSVLVVGHADADGHIITEQVRRNLALIDTFDVKTVVDPLRTKDHKAWMKLETLTEIDDSDIVFFVDMMFAPARIAWKNRKRLWTSSTSIETSSSSLSTITLFRYDDLRQQTICG